MANTWTVEFDGWTYEFATDATDSDNAIWFTEAAYEVNRIKNDLREQLDWVQRKIPGTLDSLKFNHTGSLHTLQSTLVTINNLSRDLDHAVKLARTLVGKGKFTGRQT